MTKPDTALLDKLVDWMREGGFQSLTIAEGTASITLTLPGSGAPAVAPPRPVQTVLSPGMGIFALRHPVASAGYAEPGKRVAAGDVLGLLAVGPVLSAVEAPCAGIVRRVLVAEGAVVGFEDPLFELEPVEG